MSCVIRDSEDFKETVNKLDIHPDNLEVILHKFINKEHREPTDTEILQELHGKPWEATKEELELWNKNKESIELTRFNDKDKALSTYNHVKTLFPNGSVTMYRNSKGEYIVNVGTPILKGLSFTPNKVQWNRTATNFYEVSTQGDSRFSALKAKFKPGTIIDGVDVGGMTIENVYQSVIKKSGKGKAPSKTSRLNLNPTSTSEEKRLKFLEEVKAKYGNPLTYSTDEGIITVNFENGSLRVIPFAGSVEDLSGEFLGNKDINYFIGALKAAEDLAGGYEDFSYREGYLPLWQEWAKQNPELMQELREKSAGKVLTDKFASTRVSQARALAEILNSTSSNTEETNTKTINSYTDSITPEANTIFVFGSNPKGVHGDGAAKVAKEQFGAKVGVGEGLTGNAYALPTKDLDKSRGTRWYRPTEKEEQEVKEWYKNHDYSEVSNHPLSSERTITPQQIIESIKKLYETARNNPDKQFKVSNYPLNKISLNGYLGYEMLEMFKAAGEIPSNIVFSKEWVDTGRFNIQTIGTETIKPTVVDGTPMKFNMDFKYSNEKNENITADTTLEAIKRGERTATTRYVKHGNIDRWKKAKVGDILEFNDKRGNSVLVRVTKPITQLSKDTSAEEWSAKEGWNTDRFYKNVKPEIDKGEAYQIEFELLDNNSKQDTSIESINEGVSNNMLENNGIETTEKQDIEPIIDQDTIPIKKENQDYMEKAAIINQQIDNLLNSSILSATEVRHVAEQVVFWISDHITELQETPGLAEKIYGDIFKDMDLTSMTRAEIVKAIGPDNMIAMCKEKFSPENTQFDSIKTIRKARLLTNNWQAIMTLASDAFLNVERFSIVKSKDGKTNEVREDLIADADNFGESNMESDIVEREGNLQEHWSVETRTQDVIETMSELVRRELMKCFILDNNSNPVKSEFGIMERVPLRQATSSILNWTKGTLSLKQMVDKLVEKQDSNPWIRQIISRLTSKDGKDVDFQSQFFSNFYKPFQSYSIIKEEDGKWISMPVNENPALSEATNMVITQYRIGEHPLFMSTGINKSAFNELKSVYDKLETYNHQGFNIEKEESKKEIAKNLGYISNLLGYYVTPDMVEGNLNKKTFKEMFSAITYIIRSLSNNLNNVTYNPFDFKLKDSIRGNLKTFLRPITESLEDTAISAFYDSGKMYQSYVTPSYIVKLFQKFSLPDAEFNKFIMEEYGDISWFKDQKYAGNTERGWRNEWLRLLANDSNVRKKFKHKVQLNFNQHNYMKNLSDVEYTLSILTEYFSEKDGFAWYRVPMMSNKPSSEFIRFVRYSGSNYREILTDNFKKIFDQELSRIQTVEMRNLSKEDKRFITNFDTNGRKFQFLDFMNDYLTGDKKTSELGTLIRQKLDGKKINEARLNELAKETIMEAMDAKAESIVNSWKTQNIIKGSKKIKGIGANEAEIVENLKNFVWNDTFAAMNILQLTVTDIAYYKNAEDLQKRLAELHAPGVKGNLLARDYDGNPVTDGKYRTIKLDDFDKVVSNVIDNISEVFDRKIQRASDAEKEGLELLKESLVGEDGAFRKINVTDAQAFNCPTSYRKKALMFGRWSKSAEEIYKKLKDGTYNYSDLNIAFQPLKPVVYSQIIKDTGIEGTPLNKLKVPVYYKNSEYLLILADAILYSEKDNLKRPNLLRAIYEVMEDSHFDKDGNYKTDGIDTVQFESAVKSGLAGVISLNDLVEAPNGEAIAKARLESSIYKAFPKEIKEINPETGKEESRTIYERLGSYNDVTVDTVSFEDFALQQEVPEHFKEHEQIHGSQARYIILSELDTHNYLGEPVTYNLEGKQVSAKEFKTEYEKTIAENIQESIDELYEELSLSSSNIKDKNISISKLLQREILSSPRYGVDLLQACSIDKNGNFRIPLGDPVQSKRVEQLINSIIKNRINKQKIAGGPVVQVSNFGTSRKLSIKFKDKSGNILMTREEYESKAEENKVSKDSELTILETIKEDPKYKDIYSTMSEDLKTLISSLEEDIISTTSEGRKSFVQNSLNSRVETLEKVFGDKYIEHIYTAIDTKEDNNFDLSKDYDKAKKEFEKLKKKHKNLELQFEDVKTITKEGQDLISKLQNSELTQNIYDIARSIKEKKEKLANEKVESYEDYLKKNQAGIAYFEVFAPMYINDLFYKFADKNGSINIQAINMLEPDLLKMIGYRIPTEDKYSMAPLKIVGFLPREAGNGIMFPYDITSINGSDFDVDKAYLMRKLINIKDNLDKKEVFNTLYKELLTSQSEEWTKNPKLTNFNSRGKYLTELDKPLSKRETLKEFLKVFIGDPFDYKTIDIPEASYNKLLKRYLELAYTVEKPTTGRAYRNNKIIDMTYEVLTHETSADKVLNPGNFDQQKRAGYLINAYREHGDKYTWSQLQKMTTDQLKDINNKDKNLSYIDTHIQFYKQNSAAGSLTAIFAVNRTAHAVLESGSEDGSSVYYMNVDETCYLSQPFTVAGMEFGGYMPIDMRYDRKGQLIGKTLGSMVASAVDAVKDPILNLMNINSRTANILNALVRMGMPFDDVALFLSQSVISDVLQEYNKRNITDYVTLNKVINEFLDKIKEDNNIDESSQINDEELTYEELVKGIRNSDNKEISYKVLTAFSRFQSIAEAMRMPTFATRFNSVSNSVGPLIVDNLITEYNMSNLSVKTNIVDSNYNIIDINRIFEDHPILSKFRESLDIARLVFGNMPANSTGFRNILNLVDNSYLSRRVLGDKKLLSKLSDFYQSYLLIQSGVIDSKELKYFIEEFPKEFIKKDYKKKYPDNALIQAIKYSSEKSGRTTLRIDTTGVDTQYKEPLRSAWIDLHKADHELSLKLFKYNFFKGGIGFSPKTFMSLMPVYVKEKIPGYIDTFRKLPSTMADEVLEQFIRNNWDNNKLVPQKTYPLRYTNDGKNIEIYRKSDIADLGDTMYIKVKINNVYKLFRWYANHGSSVEFEEITPLGNNKEYIEITGDSTKALTTTTEFKTDISDSDLGKDSDISDPFQITEENSTETSKLSDEEIDNLLYKALIIEGIRDKAGADEYLKRHRSHSEEEKRAVEKQTKRFLRNRFDKLGIEYNEKLIDDVYKKFC